MPRWYKMLLMPKAVNDNGEIKGFKYAGIPVFVKFRGLYDSNLKGTVVDTKTTTQERK